MKYGVYVTWSYRSYDYAFLEIDASSREEAKAKALSMAQNSELVDWHDGGIVDGEYDVINCKEVANAD